MGVLIVILVSCGNSPSRIFEKAKSAVLNKDIDTLGRYVDFHKFAMSYIEQSNDTELDGLETVIASDVINKYIQEFKRAITTAPDDAVMFVYLRDFYKGIEKVVKRGKTSVVYVKFYVPSVKKNVVIGVVIYSVLLYIRRR